MVKRVPGTFLYDLFEQSVRRVSRNRRRYRTIIITIAFGIVGLITIVNLSDAVEDKMSKHLTILGRSTIVDIEMVDDNSMHPGEFSYEDVNRLKLIPHVTDVAPHVSKPTIDASFRANTMAVRVAGVNHSFWNTVMASILEGNITSDVHEKNRSTVCVLGANVVRKLFRGASSVGEQIRIGGISCTVIGTLGGIQSLNARRTVFVPLATARHRFGGLLRIKKIRLRVDHWTNVKSVVGLAEYDLKRNHHKEIAKSIRVYYYPERIRKVEGSVAMVKALTVFASSVTLIIGGVGIAILLLAAVRDRKHEIGLKKALGATNRTIMLQFLVEGALISLLGGISGVLAGTVFCLLLHIVIGLELAPLVLAVSILGGVLAVVSIGILAGLYPARKAGRMDPAMAMCPD
jgi:putative ABC transport system permease protein